MGQTSSSILRVPGPRDLVHLLLISLTVHRIYVIVYRLFFSPLAKFPGPKLAAATSWYEAFWDLWDSSFPDRVKEMHDKYGPIIRINPWEIVIKDDEFYNQLYVPAGKRRTHTMQATRAGIGMPEAIGMTSQHEHHQMRRRPVERFFSKQNVTRLEPIIHNEARILDEKLRNLKASERIISLDHGFSCVTGDIAAQVVCDKSPELIEKPDFNPEWHRALEGFLIMMPYVRNLTWINYLMSMMPDWIVKALNPQFAGIWLFHQFSDDQIKAVKEDMAKEKDDEDGNSVFHHLLRSDLPDSEKSTSRLNSEAFSLLGAGTMSTTSALTVISYHVLANHEIQKQLSQELKDVMKDYPDTPPSWADLEKLPFLTGCVKEGLRLGRFFRRHTRISPDEDLQYQGWTIPKNTPVAMHICHTLMDPDVFPEPHRFKPERWVGDYDPRMNRNLVPFGKGSRNCLGTNLAWAELYIFVGVLFRPGGHDFSLECEESDVAHVRDSDIGFPKRGAKGLRVRVH